MRLLPLVGLLPLAGLCLDLTGCATLTTLSETAIPAQTAYVAINSFDTLEAAATVYLQLKTCTPTVAIGCKDLATARRVVAAVRVGRSARNEVEALLVVSAGGPIPVASYATLKAAMDALRAVEKS